MPEEQEKVIRELPRDRGVVELFKKLSGPDPSKSGSGNTERLRSVDEGQSPIPGLSAVDRLTVGCRRYAQYLSVTRVGENIERSIRRLAHVADAFS